MSVTKLNPLLGTDIYKIGHQLQYKPGTTLVYSYMQNRSSKTFPFTVFFGLQYYLMEYLIGPSLDYDHVQEFIEDYESILGTPRDDSSTAIKNRIEANMYALVDLGYWPIRIDAVDEGSVIPNGNCLMTIQSTDPKFYWAVGFIESMLLKLWYPMVVATCCYTYRLIVEEAFEVTVDPDQYWLKDYMVHDFGYRGDSSEEGAAISGAAHLLSFNGSDTVPSLSFLREYYHLPRRVQSGVMASVPASEHSVMCSYGQDLEFEAFENMLNLYPTGLVSIVSDTYNIYTVCTNFLNRLKDRILARNGKVVIRPDSGDPIKIICGDPDAPAGSPEERGVLRLLDDMFGSDVNSKGFKVLNPKIGLIYGDGMYMERYKTVLAKMAEMGYAASNLVIGVGGILRNHSRDTLGTAIKATYVENGGVPMNIVKTPITDPGKRSHKGRMALIMRENFKGPLTVDELDNFKVNAGGSLIAYAQSVGSPFNLLRPVFENGQLLRTEQFSTVRNRVRASLSGPDREVLRLQAAIRGDFDTRVAHCLKEFAAHP